LPRSSRDCRSLKGRYLAPAARLLGQFEIGVVIRILEAKESAHVRSHRIAASWPLEQVQGRRPEASSQAPGGLVDPT
jgi:hypothetical protein